MRGAAEKLRERAASIARIMTLEQGKPLGEAKMEVLLLPEHHRLVRGGGASILRSDHSVTFRRRTAGH